MTGLKCKVIQDARLSSQMTASVARRRWECFWEISRLRKDLMLFPHRINLPIRTYFNLSRVITWDNFNLPLSFIHTVKMSWRQQTDKLGSSFCLHLFSKGFFFFLNEMKSQFAWDILNSSRCHSNVLYLVIVTTLDFVGSGWEHFIQ